MSLKDKIQEFRKYSRLNDERIEGRERKVPASKMKTPVDPPRRGRAGSTKTAEVDGHQTSHATKRKAWKGIEYWIRDHGVPSMGEATDMDRMRAVAGITERSMFEAPQMAPDPTKKTVKVKRVKITEPEREYQSGAGNKSGMPRSPGTGSGVGYEEPALDGEFDEPEEKDSEKEPKKPKHDYEDEDEEVEESVSCCAACDQGEECEEEDEVQEAKLSPEEVAARKATVKKLKAHFKKMGLKLSVTMNRGAAGNIFVMGKGRMGEKYSEIPASAVKMGVDMGSRTSMSRKGWEQWMAGKRESVSDRMNGLLNSLEEGIPSYAELKKLAKGHATAWTQAMKKGIKPRPSKVTLRKHSGSAERSWDYGVHAVYDITHKSGGTDEISITMRVAEGEVSATASLGGAGVIAMQRGSTVERVSRALMSEVTDHLSHIAK